MFDDEVLDVFLAKQGRLFDEPVAQTREEAEYFLEDCMAQVVGSKKELIAYFEEIGVDLEGEDVTEAAEVFAIGDGRYLVVEG